MIIKNQNNIKSYLLFLITCLFILHTEAQKHLYFFKFEFQQGYTSNEVVPFWLRSNQYGSIPSYGYSISLLPKISKLYDTSKKHLWDWGFGLEGRINYGIKSTSQLIESYVKGRLGAFEVKAGRSRETIGIIGDTILSSGAFSISGNALGIPKIEIGMPEYSYIFGGNLISIKGNYAHGWIGDVPIHFRYRRPGADNVYTFFHQASLYIKLGKPAWKINLYSGFNHNVYWGNEKQIFYPHDFNMSVLKSYYYVVTGKKDIWSSVGNHLGSVDLALSYDLRGFSMLFYRQNFYDKNNLFHLTNLADGQNGIAITNKNPNSSLWHFKKILFEILYSGNQGGYNPKNASIYGDEDYYNNYVYSNGWSYKGQGLGSPFFSTAADTREGLAKDSADFFINNRLLLFHTGIKLEKERWSIITKLSYSKNQGTYSTSAYNNRTQGNSLFKVFKNVNELSTYVEINKQARRGLGLGGLLAYDQGGLLKPSVGVILKISKSFGGDKK